MHRKIKIWAVNNAGILGVILCYSFLNSCFSPPSRPITLYKDNGKAIKVAEAAKKTAAGARSISDAAMQKAGDILARLNDLYIKEIKTDADKAELAKLTAEFNNIMQSVKSDATGVKKVGTEIEGIKDAASRCYDTMKKKMDLVEECTKKAQEFEGKAKISSEEADKYEKLAEKSKDDAECHEKEAERLEKEAEKFAAGAKSAGNKATSSMDKAANALKKAKEHRDAVKTAKDVAEGFGAAAKTAKNNAELFRGQAEIAKTAAETAQGQAETAKTGAETARDGARTARDGARTARDGARTAMGEAETAEMAAKNAQDAAEASANNAATSANNANTSATQAALSGLGILTSKIQANQSARLAGLDADAVKQVLQNILGEQTLINMTQASNAIKSFMDTGDAKNNCKNGKLKELQSILETFVLSINLAKEQGQISALIASNLTNIKEIGADDTRKNYYIPKPFGVGKTAHAAFCKALLTSFIDNQEVCFYNLSLLDRKYLIEKLITLVERGGEAWSYDSTARKLITP